MLHKIHFNHTHVLRMNGQATQTLEDPLFAGLENWQKENPVRKRVTSDGLTREEGNFVTYTGKYRRKRSASRGPRGEDANDFQLVDERGVVFIRPTRFLKKEQIKQVSFHSFSAQSKSIVAESWVCL